MAKACVYSKAFLILGLYLPPLIGNLYLQYAAYSTVAEIIILQGCNNKPTISHKSSEGK
jgi:hypothetical protein